jgi:hypothetical protein
MSIIRRVWGHQVRCALIAVHDSYAVFIEIHSISIISWQFICARYGADNNHDDDDDILNMNLPSEVECCEIKN